MAQEILQEVSKMVQSVLSSLPVSPCTPPPQIQYQPGGLEEGSRVLEEISLAIELEYAIFEEQQQQQLYSDPLDPPLDLEETLPGPSFDSDADCLLCPYCRASAMLTQTTQEALFFHCPHCQNQMIVIREQRCAALWNTNQFCELLSDIFSRSGAVSPPASLPPSLLASQLLSPPPS
jgi:predicted RNA-binding Zn-ribbon protein involved in translation (DUF1610 family)